MSRRRSARSRHAAPVVRAAGEQVLDVRPDPGDPRVRVLRIDGQVHSAVDLDDPRRLTVDYQAAMLRLADALVDPAGPARVVHLGGGGFALPRALAAGRPLVDQEVIERSAAVVRLARDVLRLRPGPRLRVRTGDARRQLERLPDACADLLLGDVFDGVTTPAHLLDAGMAEVVARVLAPGGWYLLNVVDQPPLETLTRVLDALRPRLAPIGVVAAPRVLGARTAGNLVVVAGRPGPPRPITALPGAVAEAAAAVGWRAEDAAALLGPACAHPASTGPDRRSH